MISLKAGASREQASGPWPKRAAIAFGLVAVAAAVSLSHVGDTRADGPADGLTFDPATRDELVGDSKAVPVDVSAGWCPTCKVNDRAARDAAGVRARLARPDAVLTRADRSRPDPAIAPSIRSVARFGIPLDVVYGPRRPAGEPLPEPLTPSVAAGRRAFAFSSLDPRFRTNDVAVARCGASSGTSMRGDGPELSELDASWSALMMAAQDGDKLAYGRLLRECTPLVRRVVRRGLRPDQVDDVVQDVLLTIHRANTYDPTRSFSAWITVIARRRAIDLVRRGGRYDRHEVHSPLDYEGFAGEPVDPERDLFADQQGSALKAAMASLPRSQRQAIEALALRQLSLEEAAGETGKSKVALKVSMHRALKSLRERFGGSGD